jgi:hypothetical protein
MRRSTTAARRTRRTLLNRVRIAVGASGRPCICVTHARIAVGVGGPDGVILGWMHSDDASWHALRVVAGGSGVAAGVGGGTRTAAARNRNGSAVDELTAADPKRILGQHSGGGVSHVNAVHLAFRDLADFAWAAEVNVDVHWMPSIRGEVVSVWQLHFLLTAIRGKEHALTVAKDAEMDVVRRSWCDAHE